MKKRRHWLGLPFILFSGIAQAQPGNVMYVYTDPQGTPLAEGDAGGNITAAFDYTPYGRQALGTSPVGPGYTGHVNDPDTRLIYMQARYYDHDTGRFLSPDPVAPSASRLFGFNRYNYGSNNPVNNIDPDGRDDCPGQSRSRCIRSDSGKARDLRSTAQQDSAAIDNRSKVETSQKPEKALAMIGTTDVSVQPASGQIIQSSAKDGIDLTNLPTGTTAVEHSHIDGKTVGVSSDGFISPGDAQPLKYGLINYAVSEGRVAKYEIVDGRIQVTAIKGAFSSRESNKLEKSINNQQEALDIKRPIE